MVSRTETTTTCCVLWITLLTLCLLGGCDRIENQPNVINGYTDLSQRDFEKDGIVALDGQQVRHMDSLLALLSGERVGSTVPVRIVRSGQVQELQVTLGERP